MTNEIARIRIGKNTKEIKRFETFTFFWEKTIRSVRNDIAIVTSNELNNNVKKTKRIKYSLNCPLVPTSSFMYKRLG
jgi:hypothetical protein